MTQPEGQTPDRGRAPATGVAAPATPDAPGASLWEALYLAAPPARREELVELARRQGVLYAHQVPADAAAPRPGLLAALLGGQAGALAPFRAPPFEPEDPDLDPEQREAVARALFTPDVCLIQGLPGTGKSRVVVELVARAAARGERVLLLAPGAPALDRVLESLAGREGLCPVRCLGADESADALPPAVRRLTVAGHQAQFGEHTLARAREQAEADRREAEALRRQEECWGPLAALAAQHDALAARAAELEGRRARLAVGGLAEEPAGASGRAGLAAAARGRDEALARLDARQDAVRAELEKLRAEAAGLAEELAPLRPLAAARRGFRFWSPAWWRGLGQGDVARRAAELEQRRERLREEARRCESASAGLAAGRAAAEARFADERARLCAGEAACLRAEADAEAAALAQERQKLGEEWQAARRAAGMTPPAGPARQAAAAARADWARRLGEAEARAAAAEEWARAEEESAAELPERLRGWANVVAATTAALADDPQFGTRCASPTPFDLMVLEEAEQVTESEFQAAARRARRWVLVGEPAAGDPDPPAGRGLRPAALRPGFFQRLWGLLHPDPRRLPYRWEQRGGRLNCRLRPVPAGQERWVQAEPVADRPDIELHILAPPRSVPQLAEVVFPETMTLGQAKAFIAGELEELAVQVPGPAPRWAEEPGRVVVRFAEGPDAGAVAVPLAPGVEELVVPPAAAAGVAFQTRALTFDAAAGWTADSARRWVADRLPLADRGRTALLRTPHRMHAPLARFLSDLLFAGAYAACPAPPGDGGGVSVEFVPVPAPEGEPGRGRGEGTGAPRWRGAAAAAPRLRVAKAGAGLEVDLADPRRLDPLPAELRGALPDRGLVNYLEAQAVVAYLEGLLADADFREAAARWGRQGPCVMRTASPCPPGCRGHGPAVAVIALYPAQAALLRQLIRQRPALCPPPVAVEVGLPADFRQRECLAALVSLTRSHSHRPVGYGEGPHLLDRALTRASGRVVLFGDPGTLARRGQWHEPLEHLDAYAAGRERALAAQLVGYLQGRGPHAESFCVRQGAGA
jgi:hypothetical protein